MNFFKKFFITFLLLTSLNLTQNFAMEPDPNEDQNMEQIEQDNDSMPMHFGGGSSSSSSSSSSSNSSSAPTRITRPHVSTSIILKCCDGEIEIPSHLLVQSITLSQFADIGQNTFNIPESFFPDREIVATSLITLKDLMQRAYDIAQLQETVNLKNITKQLSLDIQQFFIGQIEFLINISDFLGIPLISNACAHAVVTNDRIIIDSRNIENFAFFKSKMDDLSNIYINDIKPELSLFDNIAYGEIPFFVINKLLGLNPKDLNFYQIFENCISLKLFCNKILASPDNSVYLSSFLDQIPNQNLKDDLLVHLVGPIEVDPIEFDQREVGQIEDILDRTEIGKKFSVVINSNVLYLDLTPKKFLNFLLVLPTKKIAPFLEKLAKNINSLTGYNHILAQALLVIKNHSTKKNILMEFGIDKEHINNTKRSKILDLSDNDLGNPENLNKLLFYIAIAQVLKINELFLSDNQLTSLPAEIGNLSNLTKLNLDFNKLTNLPTEIGNLTNLTHLNLFANNQLTNLSVEIGNLSNLTELDLNRNQLTSLPAQICNLTSLIRLYLSSNQLTSLPVEICNLSNLKYLDLINNPGLMDNPEALNIIEKLKAKSIFVTHQVF